MKRIIIKPLFFCILLGCFILNNKVFAKELTLNLASFYYTRTTENGQVNSWNYPIYKIDGETTYCIDFDVEQGINYEIASWNEINLDNNKKEQILLTAYYGYEYPNHQTEAYLAATQAILWELTATEKVNVTFNTKRFNKGENIDFSKEKDEILQLVNHHFDKPSIKDKYQINLNGSLELNDSLFSNYDVVSDGNLKITKNDNKLIINANKIGIHKIRLVRKQIYSHPYYILTSKGYQNMLMAGNLEPFYIDLEIEVLSGNIIVNKKDFNTHDNILQSGIKFKLKDLKGNYICQDSCFYETDEKGHFIINNLPYGTYFLEEVDSFIEGYLWNNEVMPILVNSNNKIVNFYNKPVYGNIKISKYGEMLNFVDNKTNYEKILLSDVKYILKAREDIILNKKIVYHKDEIVKEIKTNNEGKFEIPDLPLGLYYLYEDSSVLNHLVDKKIYNIDLIYKDQYTEKIYFEKNFYNYLPKGEIKIIKQDKNTKEALEGVKFGLYNNDKLLLTCITDNNGECLFDDIAYGKYTVKELECLEEYLPNNDIYEVNLDDNKQIIEIFNEKEKIEFVPKEVDEPLEQIKELEEDIVEVNVPDTSSSNISILILLILLVVSFFNKVIIF